MAMAQEGQEGLLGDEAHLGNEHLEPNPLPFRPESSHQGSGVSGFEGPVGLLGTFV